MRNLDTTAAWLRHVSKPRVDQLLEELGASLPTHGTGLGGPSLALEDACAVEVPSLAGMNDSWLADRHEKVYNLPGVEGAHGHEAENPTATESDGVPGVGGAHGCTENPIDSLSGDLPGVRGAHGSTENPTEMQQRGEA